MTATQATGPRAALAHRPFRNWFIVQIFSGSGSSTQMIGMAWLVVRATGSGVALGLLTALSLVPVLLLGPLVGTLIDRMSRRVLLVATQSAYLVLATVLAATTAADHTNLPVLYGVALLTGIVNAVDGPARQVYLVDLVGPQMIPATVGLYEVVLNASRVLGPAAGGALLATWGVVPCFVFNAITFVPVLLVLIFTHSGHEERAKSGERASFTAGIRWVAANPHVAWMLLFAAVSGMLFNLSVTVPLVTQRVFGLGGGAYGALVAVFGVGALVGALAASNSSGTPRFRTVALLAGATGAAIVLSALAPSEWLFGLGLAAIGGVSILFIARANALVQLESPAHMRGRVMSLWNMAIPGMNPFTGLAAGAVADAFGARAGFGLAGALFLVVFTATLVFGRAHGRDSAPTG
ncbi:MAG: MFS transporter [Microbacteriaceae bacterium]|nr:MFS transporter [Microbacteriaceae bacterium]MCL2793880.1 MFS transporter [Microbacteriaceae bacterium]